MTCAVCGMPMRESGSLLMCQHCLRSESRPEANEENQGIVASVEMNAVTVTCPACGHEHMIGIVQLGDSGDALAEKLDSSAGTDSIRGRGGAEG